MFNFIRRQLFWKLFISHLAVLLLTLLVVLVTAFAAAPAAFDRYIADAVAEQAETQGVDPEDVQPPQVEPPASRGPNRPPWRQPQPPRRDPVVFQAFRSAITASLRTAMLVSVLAAGIASIVIARWIVRPVQDMRSASQRIAEGDYDERVTVPDEKTPDELSELAISFNQMAGELGQTEATRRELLGNVAHELRTPLTTIKGTMEALMDGVLPADDTTYLQVYREADRLQHLVHDLQELSRVEAGAFVLERHPLRVADLLQTTRQRLQLQFDDKGVALLSDLPADLPPVFADEHRIGQVLLNLVGNALQYTPAAGTVTLRARHEDGMVAVSVQDSGAGIPAADLRHIFDRFYRVDKSRSRVGGGSGIGLTIARRLVIAHGGTIHAHSDGPGHGSTFTFTLPVAPG